MVDSPNESRDRLEAVLYQLSDGCSLAKLLSGARKLEAFTDDFKEVRFAILRNLTFEPVLPAAIYVACATQHLRASVFMAAFDDVEAQAFESASECYASKPDIIILAMHLQTIAPDLLLRFASLNPERVEELSRFTLSKLLNILTAIRERSNAIILVNNFDLPTSPCFGILDPQMESGQRRTIAKLNADLAEAVSAIKGGFVVDLDRIVSNLGNKAAIDARFWHLARAPYTLKLQRALANEYAIFAAALTGNSKKCLILDCDNTLWGGIVGEDGVEGIALGPSSPGSAFLEMQAAVLDFYERGVLLVIASKNNAADVDDVLTNHPFTLLRSRHFVATRINWRDKVSNIRELAAELNIGLDSMLFVDDNPFERDLVRKLLPEVKVVDLPPDPSRYASFLRALNDFDTLSLTAEDRRRSQTYKSNAARLELKQSTNSIESYLRSLRMHLSIGYSDKFSAPRIAQLTQKTNQFNLTTRRYTETDIYRMTDDPRWRVYFAELSDAFDSAGIIAAALVYLEDRQTAYLDTFLMSCRVIGRGVENAFIATIINDCKQLEVLTLNAEFIPTSKNSLAEGFLEKFGFKPVKCRPGRWSFDLMQASVATPSWFSAVTIRECGKA